MGRKIPEGEAGAIAAPLILGMALVLGGGGSPSPLPEILLQISTALGVALWLHRHPRALASVPSGAWWIAGLVTALHLVQLVPLPPTVWHALPGRSVQVAALELIQAERSWRPLSLSPSRTLASLLCALSALALLLLTTTIGHAARWRLIGIVAIAGAITLLLGAAQIKGEVGNPLRFYNPAQAWLTGFFANRNSAADLILVALVASAALAWRFRPLAPSPWSFAAVLVAIDLALLVGLFLTGSRTGIALAPIILIAQLVILLPGNRPHAFALTVGMTCAAVIAAMSFVTLRNTQAVAVVAMRFTHEKEFRPELWRDAVFALQQYWPFGAGQGTIVPVLIAAERLEVVDPTLPNRAHNDFLELAIEGGLTGLIVLALIGVILFRTARSSWRTARAGGRAQIMFATTTLVILAAHSLVDYPLRSMALAGMAAAAAGLLFPPPAARPGS